MAANVELPAEERVRELTADPKLTAEDANRYGDLFVSAGKYPIAMMFFERSKDRTRLAQVKKDAIRMGDAFLLHGITRLVSDLVEPAEWKEAGEVALREGKILFARDCFEKAGDAEKAAAARAAYQDLFKVDGAAAPPPPPAEPAK
ncbi:MAG: hypothetical protein EHM91_02655 [Planctomycetota bacterium]|nr:MAG: hypothetical protein EHM91_02655 [Planctomycetota bacterium]